jgi:hypothetical protein
MNVHYRSVKVLHPQILLTLIFSHFRESDIQPLGTITVYIPFPAWSHFQLHFFYLSLVLGLSPSISHICTWSNQWFLAVVMHTSLVHDSNTFLPHDSGSWGYRFSVGATEIEKGQSHNGTSHCSLELETDDKNSKHIQKSKLSSIDLTYPEKYCGIVVQGMGSRVKLCTLECQHCRFPSMTLCN